MNATVLVDYYDRITGELHRPGETVELTEARAAELAGGGFVAADKPRPRRRATPKKAE